MTNRWRGESPRESVASRGWSGFVTEKGKGWQGACQYDWGCLNKDVKRVCMCVWECVFLLSFKVNHLKCLWGRLKPAQQFHVCFVHMLLFNYDKQYWGDVRSVMWNLSAVLGIWKNFECVLEPCAVLLQQIQTGLQGPVCLTMSLSYGAWLTNGDKHQHLNYHHKRCCKRWAWIGPRSLTQLLRNKTEVVLPFGWNGDKSSRQYRDTEGRHAVNSLWRPAGEASLVP